MSQLAGSALVTDSKVDILVVDDNSSNVIAVEAMLELLGQNIVRAASGTEALRYLLERDFAVTLLDVQMPELDGFETARIIRSRERSRHMPILFLTAFSRDDGQISEAYELGALDILFKPIAPFILRAKVQAFVELYRKTLEIKRQGALLRQAEQREHERRLADAALRWQTDRLHEEMLREREVAATLARTVADRELAETALQASFAELELRNNELANADRRKDEFLAMLAHELRNPMAPIVSAVELLRMPGASEAVTRRALGALDRQTGHMVRLIDDLLDVSRITTGKIELRCERVTLASIVNHAIQISAPLMTRWEHTFDSSLPNVDVMLNADGTRLTQVFANLLNNAAKYSPPRSKIHLDAECDGGTVVVRVRDNGIGIGPGMIDEVFGLFVQADRTADRAQGGLGVGLTIVKNLVEMHGGSVTVSSAGLNQGCEFLVRLPIADELAVVTEALTGPPPPQAPPHSYRVMVIEDNEDVRDTMKDMLEFYGHDTSCASDGPGGVEAVLSVRPDVAFIDVGLPGLDGYQVVAALLARDPHLATRLIALTGYGRPKDRERALAAGFDQHIVKPVTSSELLKLIEPRAAR